jgi:hypothetical protein
MKRKLGDMTQALETYVFATLKSTNIKYDHLNERSPELKKLKVNVEQKYLEKLSNQVEAQNKEYFESKARDLLM